MCSIIDGNGWGEVFGKQTEAGKCFYKWLKGHGRLIVGGTRMFEESGNRNTHPLYSELIRAGKISVVTDTEVDVKENELKAQGGWKSKDKDCHILALAVLREHEVHLLYSNDEGLHKDIKAVRRFKKPRLLIYSTKKDNGACLEKHRRMLGRNLCT